MNRRYFRTLFYCILVSVLVLAASAFFRLAPWVGLLGGILPLVYYHIVYLTPQASKGLTSTAIDSVYYFGFLVTVSALGISAISIAVRGAETNLTTVIYQFGVGLFATGYAVVARMHLTSVSALVDEASPEALMDRYVKRSVELVTNVEMASSQLTEFSREIIARTVDMSDAARLSSEKMMLDMARAFESEMKLTLVSARDSLAEIRGLVSDTSFVVEREELARSLRSTLDTTTALNAALTDLAQCTGASAGATKESITATNDLKETVLAFGTHISVLGGESGAFAVSAASMADATAQFAECYAMLSLAAESLREMTSTVADTGPTFKQMRTLTKKASEQLDALGEASGRINSSLEQMVHVASASDALAVGMHKVTSAIEPLASGSQMLASRFTDVVNMSGELNGRILDLPEQTALLHSTANEVTAGLNRIFGAIAEAAANSEKLSDQSGQASQAVDGATRLLETAGQLQQILLGLQKGVDGFTTSLQTAQRSMVDSTAGIKTVMHDSAKSLESDVKRSTDAASLLTEKLTQVAQNIINRTNRETV